jgi:hypothetical protein
LPGSLRIQSEIASSAAAQYSGVFQTILKVAKDEGVLKLWSGVSVSFTAIVGLF